MHGIEQTMIELTDLTLWSGPGRFVCRGGAAVLLGCLLMFGDASAAEPARVIRDTSALPPPVAEMHQALFEAASARSLAALDYAIELNEMPPIIGPPHAGEALAYLERMSAGKDGDVLHWLENILGAPYLVTETGGSTMYVWPAYAELPLADLAPADKAKLFSLAPAHEVARMLAAGRWTGWSLGISEHGVWHYLVKGDAGD